MKTIEDYQAAYSAGQTPKEVLRDLWEKIQRDDDPGIFILKFSWEEIEAQLDTTGPLAGIPFVVKDNIDIAGFPTTAGCPDYSYLAKESAPAVSLLQQAGAVCFGKTNLDQFATGLVGVRTPYPAPLNAFDPDYLPGGSSCGSAIAVAKELAVFSLGTDTAGSGRVPAAFNELIGLKPSRGYLSTRGVVDACKSLDCVSIFAQSCADAEKILALTAQTDLQEPWSRPAPSAWPRLGKTFTFGVPHPDALDFFGWDEARDLFEKAIQKLIGLGGTPVEIDLAPFLSAARLLYEGPWVTERYVGIQDFLKNSPDSIFPVTRQIIASGEKPSARDAFTAQYRLAECKLKANGEMAKVDFVILPTTPRNFTVAEVEEEPVKLNSILGTYTNFMNLLDYSALALPAGKYQEKLPWGITLFAEEGMDRALLELGSKYESSLGRGPASTSPNDWDEVQVAVCGAHLQGMALNWQLTDRNARLAYAGATAPCYRMYLIPADDNLPERPALVHTDDGVSIELEVWTLTREAFGDFVSKVPAPLGIGKVLLKDGTVVPGFIAEARASLDATDLSGFGGWRGYKSSL